MANIFRKPSRLPYPTGVSDPTVRAYLTELIRVLMLQEIDYPEGETRTSIPMWSARLTYTMGDVIMKTGTTELYKSAVSNNTNNPLPSATSDAFWTYLGDLANL